MFLFKSKYRIIEDVFFGYEVQIKRWWFPFWKIARKTGNVNTFNDVDAAKIWIDSGCPKDEYQIKKRKKTIIWKSK